MAAKSAKAAKAVGKIRVGISGWTYPDWRGAFYPKGVTQKKELAYASRQLNTIEVNGTFYSLQRPETFQSWYDQTPADFRFAVKGGQFITHVRRLKEVDEPLATFFASGVLCLKEKLGPVLWQFPPNVALKDDRFEKFLKLLPFDSAAAAELAKGHSSRIAGRAWTEAGGDYPVRHAFEFRHPSFKHPDFLAMMREYGAAVVIADAAGKAPLIEDLTADFVYARMHGQSPDHSPGQHAKGYPPSEIKRWAKRLEIWAAGGEPKDAERVLPSPAAAPASATGAREVFVYFSTEAKAYSPFDAMNLLRALKIELPESAAAAAS